VSTRYKKQLLFTKKELLNDVFLRSLTVSICVVADFKGITFQLHTVLFLKQTILDKSQKPLLRIFVVTASYLMIFFIVDLPFFELILIK